MTTNIICLDENPFPDKAAKDLTKEEILNILSLEEKENKKVLFYKLKNETTSDICYIYYHREGNEQIAFSKERVQNFLICRRFWNKKYCNTILRFPGGSIK